jgi:protein SCO1/2
MGAGLSARGQVVLDSVPELAGVGITEHLGKPIPKELVFTDETGRQVTLGEYFTSGKPVILNLVYFQCPMLCNLVLNGMTTGVRGMEWLPGEKFEMVAVSINPRETYQLAYAKKQNYLSELGKPGAEAGWHFLVGDSTQSKALADALGFGYTYDSETKEFAHSAAAFVLMPDGTISRYLYGIEFSPRDLKLALLEASDGKIGSTLDKLILYCFHYDPAAKGYVLFAINVMKIGGAVSALALGLFVAIMWRSERKNRLRRSSLAIHPHVTGNGR